MRSMSGWRSSVIACATDRALRNRPIRGPSGHRGGTLLAPEGHEVETRPPAIGDERAFPFGPVLLGRGWQRSDGSIELGPHDFSRANFLPLADSLAMLRAFLLPDTVPARQRWRIDGALRCATAACARAAYKRGRRPALRRGRISRRSCALVLVGDGKARFRDGSTCSAKAGKPMASSAKSPTWSTAPAASNSCSPPRSNANADGIYNDDRYEYDGVSLPFMASRGCGARNRTTGAPTVGCHLCPPPVIISSVVDTEIPPYVAPSLNHSATRRIHHASRRNVQCHITPLCRHVIAFRHTATGGVSCRFPAPCRARAGCSRYARCSFSPVRNRAADHVRSRPARRLFALPHLRFYSPLAVEKEGYSSPASDRMKAAVRREMDARGDV